MSSNAPDDPAALPCARIAARWLAGLSLDDVPIEVVAHARLRLLDVLGVMLAASALDYGRVIRAAVRELAGAGPCPIVGFADRVSPAWAAFANGALAHALIFDDTHNETIVHASAPVASAALAIASARDTSGAELLTTFIGATELTCRLGLAAVGQFHKRGFQPTAIVGPPGAAFAAARLLELDETRSVHAVGNTGSFAAGITESWADGTWTQLLHPGWAAHSGVAAAVLAKHGWSGPATVFEGRSGLFRTHVQDPAFPFAFERITADLGSAWESRRVSFKPYPCAHVIHPFLDAILHLRDTGLRAENVASIECRIAGYMVPVVCEPVAGKVCPASDAQARTSLQFSVAEALITGRLDASSYAPATLGDPRVRALAERVIYVVDDTAPDSRQFMGWIVATTNDGRRLERIEPFNRGSPDHPLGTDEVLAKFRRNAASRLAGSSVAAIERSVMAIEDEPSIGPLMAACTEVRLEGSTARRG